VDLTFGPQDSWILAERAGRLSMGARELAAFVDSEPGLAAECGVEVGALEARSILAGGAPARVAARATETARTGRSVPVPQVDMEALSRLEVVLAQSAMRIGTGIATLDAAQARSESGMERLGSIIGLAGAAVGLARSLSIF
jgi:hypothetical protein